MSDRAPWATLDDVRRMIEGSRVYRLHELDGYLPVRLVATPPEHTDCPDPGPAKEAAPASFSTGTTPAEVIAKSLRGTATATGAPSVDAEAEALAQRAHRTPWNLLKLEILALVKREREAALSRFADEIVEVFSSQNATAPERDILEYVKAARDRELAR